MKGYRITYTIEGLEDKNFYIKTVGINENDAILNLRDMLNEYDNLNLSIISIVEIPLGSITIGELTVAEFEKYYRK